MGHKRYVFIYGLLIALMFEFPCPAQTHHSNNTTTDAALKEVLKNNLTEHDVENDGSTRYMASFVDHNNDGKKEVIVHIISPHLCGTGGCPTLVLVSQRCSFRVMSQISITRPPIRVLKAKSHGWHDLAVGVAGGGIQPGYEADLPFEGESYVTNPTVPPARKLHPHSAGRIVIANNAVGVPLD